VSAVRHPIQVVARRTGLSADVIRAWEKRYEVVSPVRSATGRRLYSDGDIDRLRLLARSTASGRSIGQVATLTTPALAALVHGDVTETPAVAEPDPGLARSIATATSTTHEERGSLAHVTACLDALRRFDVVELDVSLRRASVVLSAETFLDALVVPLRDRVSEEVRTGALHDAHEHLAIAALRRALERVAEAAPPPPAPPVLLVATPLGQPHEIDALITAATASVEGWRAIYAGAGLPPEAIAELAAQLGARGVALSLGTFAGDRAIPRELRRLRLLVPRDVAILIGGPAADASRRVLREIGAEVVRDAVALRSRLRTLRES
jgi:DNA-binding transcriptional MerR regulator